MTVLYSISPTHHAVLRRNRPGAKTEGKTNPTNDLWIAALCRQHGLPLLSRDLHFDSVAGSSGFSGKERTSKPHRGKPGKTHEVESRGIPPFALSAKDGHPANSEKA